MATPSKSLPHLIFLPNQYVVPEGGEFHYFPIRVVGKDNPLFLYFEKTPPIIRDGIIMYKKRVFAVTTKDLMRKRFYNKPSEKYARLISMPTKDEQRLIPLAVPSDPAADLLFDEQVRTVFGIVPTEEGEWEIADHSQPQLGDEIGPIQDSDQDSRERGRIPYPGVYTRL